MTAGTHTSRRRAVLGLASGVCLIVAAALLYAFTRPEPAGMTVQDAGAAAAQALAGPSGNGTAGGVSSTRSAATGRDGSGGSSTSATRRPATTSPPAAPSATEPTTSPTRTPTTSPPPPTSAPSSAPATAPAPTRPVRLALPRLGIEAEVVPVGVRDDGEMEVPADVATVGWYRFGPLPGSSTGSAVLTGHVDSADQGPGAFAQLGAMEPGDLFQVTDADGTGRTFQVVARESWPKTEVPLDRIFDRSGEGRLVLITCGGAFADGAGSYLDNIAITAIPVR
ncbi:sortase [Nakamurella sp. YIM 132087]|uniref:Sortase n=1 Tax=Nakamurella alba TaxID=2665158 RepID=A0A7K1FM56_9ACTN|nr:class F sortase [Nakamurella alba]MTD15198.1 sortase [Nakamurella alba]